MKLRSLFIIFGVGGLLLAGAPALRAATEADVDQMTRDLARYKTGEAWSSIDAIDQLIRQTRPGDPLRQRLEGKLIELIGSADAQLDARRAACRHLWIIGTEASLPALEKLLASEDLCAMACYALRSHPSLEANAALRRALEKASGPRRIQIVNALGDRRDAKAAEMLGKIAQGDDTQARDASIAALGRIGAATAAEALTQLEANKDVQAQVKYALLQCAQRMARSAEPATARPIFARLYDNAHPSRIRRAALIGLAGLGGPEATQAILAGLRGEDQVLAATAAAQIPTLKEAAGQTFVAELKSARPEIQPFIMRALAERKEAAALPAITELASAPTAEVAVAALEALGRLGDPAAVPTLVNAAARQAAQEQSQAALASLRQMPGEPATAAIIAAAPKVPATARPDIFETLVSRQAFSAAPMLLEQAADQDDRVAAAAFKALARLAGPDAMDKAIALLAGAAARPISGEAEQAIVQLARKLPNPAKAQGELQPVYQSTQIPEARAALLRVMGQIGAPQALKTLQAATQDKEAAVREAALRALAAWPTANAAPTLLTLARQAERPTDQIMLLRGYLRLLELPSTRAEAETTQAYAEGLKLAQRPDEKWLALGGLARTGTAQALPLVLPLLDNPETEVEAAQAVVAILKTDVWADPAQARPALQKAAASTKADDKLKQQARALLGRMARKPAVGQTVSLFNGKNFQGWEGDTAKTFRIQDGAIVGGGMGAPVPRNEFLTTQRVYANFVVRLEFKLIGDPAKANAGVQIRSRRIPNHFEMIGYQADMGQTYWGSLYDESRRRKVVAAADAEVIKRVLKPGEWNTYEIRCEGRRIRLALNGVQTVDYTEADETIPQRGVIALQIHGGPASEAWYRNITIEELP